MFGSMSQFVFIDALYFFYLVHLQEKQSWPFRRFTKLNRSINSSNVKQLPDDNVPLDENGRKFSKWVENSMGKGEIAHKE